MEYPALDASSSCLAVLARPRKRRSISRKTKRLRASYKIRPLRGRKIKLSLERVKRQNERDGERRDKNGNQQRPLRRACAHCCAKSRAGKETDVDWTEIREYASHADAGRMLFIIRSRRSSVLLWRKSEVQFHGGASAPTFDPGPASADAPSRS
jgi:hypothetical protein